ncbi:lipoprotein-releasing system ATP-binding protein LolD, partial [Vibrio sp. 10N.261.45.A7]
ALSIYDLMRELNREYDTAFLVVTHDGELAGKMDRQLHMKDGLLVNVEKEES